MDHTTEYLSDYACRLAYGDLSPEAVHQVKRTLVDALGCAVGAFHSEPGTIARRVASSARGDRRLIFWARGSRRPWTWQPSRTRCSSATGL